MTNFRHAEPSDLSAVADLLLEVEQFYGTVDFPPRQHWEQHIESAIFGAFPAARVLLAIEGSKPLGFASYSFLWPAAGVSKSLFLKELYVREAHRRSGIGVELIARLHAIAIETGSSRVEWQTDTQNVDAQAFYKKLGAVSTSGKVLYRSEGDVLGKISGLRSGASPLPD